MLEHVAKLLDKNINADTASDVSATDKEKAEQKRIVHERQMAGEIAEAERRTDEQRNGDNNHDLKKWLKRYSWVLIGVACIVGVLIIPGKKDDAFVSSDNNDNLVEEQNQVASIPEELDIFTNLEKDEMVFVEGGTFLMGAQSNDPSAPNYNAEAFDDESPVHQVTLSDYYIGKYEVTQQLWEYVMSYTGTCADGSSMRAYSSDVWLGDNPSSSYGLGDYYPAYYVSWEDVVNIFIPRLNKITGQTFRLPTEAEWEYAARGGHKSKGYKYAGSNTIDDVAWYYGNTASSTHAVGTRSPNELGLYDMSGNVWEWCSDWYGVYSSSSQTNPTGPSSGSDRVLRGGSWLNFAENCRVSNRGIFNPDYRYNNYGFRLVLSL